MIIKIKYQDPNNLNEFIIEELDDNIINVPEYCGNLHKTKLCDDKEKCNGENCKIWIETNGEFILAGVQD